MGLVAWLCGALLALGLAGRVLAMRQDVLRGSPFSTFLIPGLALALVVGGSQLSAGWAELRRRPWAGGASLLAGIVLAGWIVGEVALLGWVAPHVLQPLCFSYGALEVALARFGRTRGRRLQPGRATRNGH